MFRGELFVSPQMGNNTCLENSILSTEMTSFYTMCDICRLQTGRLYIVLPIPSNLNNLTEVLFWLTGVLVWLTEALVWLTEVLVWLTQARVCKSAVCICRTPLFTPSSKLTCTRNHCKVCENTYNPFATLFFCFLSMSDVAV